MLILFNSVNCGCQNMLHTLGEKKSNHQCGQQIFYKQRKEGSIAVDDRNRAALLYHSDAISIYTPLKDAAPAFRHRRVAARRTSKWECVSLFSASVWALYTAGVHQQRSQQLINISVCLLSAPCVFLYLHVPSVKLSSANKNRVEFEKCNQACFPEAGTLHGTFNGNTKWTPHCGLMPLK